MRFDHEVHRKVMLLNHTKENLVWNTEEYIVQPTQDDIILYSKFRMILWKIDQQNTVLQKACGKSCKIQKEDIRNCHAHTIRMKHPGQKSNCWGFVGILFCEFDLKFKCTY